jgi:hypothetical protein
MAIQLWSSIKSTKTRTAPKTTWTPIVLKYKKLEKKFEGLEIMHVLRDSNVATHVLAKLGSDRAKVLPGVFIEELPSPSIK